MAYAAELERALELAELAIQLSISGKAEDASRALREAFALAPDSAEVQAAFSKLSLDNNKDALLKLCHRFSEENDVTAGSEALSFLESRGTQVSIDLAEECLLSVIGAGKNTDKAVKDALIASFLRNCTSARSWLAKRLQGSVTATFGQIFEIGDGAANGMAATVLDTKIWANDASRIDCENGVFQLFMAKLMESGHDYDGRAMKGISRLLAVDAQRLQTLLDEDSFDAILEALDNRWPEEVRSQATLATAKYLEFSKEKGEKYLTRFITTRVKRHANHDLGIAFSAAAAVFPLVPTVAANLFLSEGFLPSLVSLLEKDTRSKKVEQAALDMLNAACIDSACREDITKYCSRWLHFVMRTNQDQSRGQAAVIIAKLKTVNGSTANGSTATVEKVEESRNGVGDIVSMFEGMLREGSDIDNRNAIEGLAFASTDPKTKEAIVKNQDLLNRLLRRLKNETSGSSGFQSRTYPYLKTTATSNADFNGVSNAFGTLSIIDNLTRYLPQLCDDEKRLSQLKAYANASKTQTEPDPLDDNAHVRNRGTAVLEAQVVPYLEFLEKASRPKGLSPTCLTLMAGIILSLSRHVKNRCRLTQQGAISFLHKIYESPSQNQSVRHTAAHALARICISVDPALLNNRIGSSVDMLLTLLADPPSSSPDGPRNLLPQFETLMALTNFASNTKLGGSGKIVNTAFTEVEDLLLSSNALVQRGATELVCNLMTSPDGLMKFADGSKAADRRIHILLALADAEDVGTRRAAGGALAMASEFEAVVRSILGRERGVKLVLGLCRDEDEGCVRRGMVCLRNIAEMAGEMGERGREAIREAGGLEVLKELMEAPE